MNSAKGALVLPRLIQIVEQSSPDSVQDLTTQERYAGIKKGIEQIWWCSPDTPEAAGHGREAPETLHEERQWSHSHSAIHAWEDKWRRICMKQSLRAREWLEKAKVKTIHTQTKSKPRIITGSHWRPSRDGSGCWPSSATSTTVAGSSFCSTLTGRRFAAPGASVAWTKSTRLSQALIFEKNNMSLSQKLWQK